jgi:hypothetical protein
MVELFFLSSHHNPRANSNYSLLKTAMNKAMEWRFLENNPIDRVKSPKAGNTFHFFGKEEITRLIETSEESLKPQLSFWRIQA